MRALSLGSAALLITAVAAAAADVPAPQAAVIAAAEKARSAFDEAPNDMAKGGVRAARAKAICAAVPKLTAKDWIGEVDTLSSNGDGWGILYINIGPDISVRTYNNAFSDAGSNTLIDPSSDVFAVASTLSVGQKVRFSGRFFKAKADCIKEMSLTQSGSIEEPAFLIRYSDVAPLD